MSKPIQLNTQAPDFVLNDLNGDQFQLSDYHGRKNIVLIFNRGFLWPFCRAHMAQLRQEFDKFIAQDALIVVVGPENQAGFAKYWEQNDLHFIGLPDPKHTVLKMYGQQVKLFKLGRMPAQVIIDKEGIVRFAHFGHSMSDIPENDELLASLAEINEGISETPYIKTHSHEMV